MSPPRSAAFRLFIAIDLPPREGERLVALTKEWRATPVPRWTQPDAMHLTLHFIGDGIPAERMNTLREALHDVKAQSFTLHLRGVGKFPPGKNTPPRVLWAGIAESSRLLLLYAAIARVLLANGFAVERRPFHPHITLTRLKSSADTQAVNIFLQEQARFAGEPFLVEHFTLFISRHGKGSAPDESPYEVLATYPLSL